MALDPTKFAELKSNLQARKQSGQGLPDDQFEKLKATLQAKKTQPSSLEKTFGTPGGFAVGVAKGLGETVKGSAEMLQKFSKFATSRVGQPVVSAFTGIPLPVRKTEGIPALTEGTPQEKQLSSLLTPKTSAEKIGKTTESVAEWVAPVLGGSLKALTKGPQIARSLEKASLQLTPTQKRELGGKINQVTDYLVSKGISGNPSERVEKINTIYNSMEDKLQNFLKTSATKGISATKSEILKDLESLKSKYASSRDVESAETQINDVIKLLKKRYSDAIPLDRLNILKRTTYSNAYNKAGTKVLDDVEHGIGDVLRSHLEKSTTGLKIDGKDIGEFNKEYGTIIDSRNLLKIAESRPEIRTLGRVISAIIGGGLGGALGGGPVGAGVGVLSAESVAPLIAGTKARTLAAQALEKGGKIAQKILPSI